MSILGVDVTSPTQLEVFEPLHFPLKIEIIAVITYEIRQIAMFSKNSPSVRVDCGVFDRTTKTMKSAGANADWTSLGWKFLMKETNQLKVEVLNNSKPFTRFVVPGPQLLSLPRDLMGNYCTPVSFLIIDIPSTLECF